LSIILFTATFKTALYTALHILYITVRSFYPLLLTHKIFPLFNTAIHRP